MRLVRTLQRRMLAAVFVSTWFGGLVILALFSWASIATVSRIVANVLEEEVQTLWGPWCETEPLPTFHRSSTGVRIDLFPRDSVNEGYAHPELDPLAHQMAVAFGGAQFRYYLTNPDGYGGAVLLLAPPESRCGAIQVRWPMARFRSSFWLITLALAALAAFLGWALSAREGTRPVWSRLTRIARAARHLGDRGYHRFDDPTPDELGELAAALDRSHERIRANADELLERQTRLERVLSDVAHDVLTPVASLQMLVEAATTEDDATERRALLLRALDQTVYLASLTRNLSLAARLREGVDPTAHDARVDLSMVVARVTERMRILAERHGTEVAAAVPDGPVWVRCHPVMMEQAVGNLAHNAVRHHDRPEQGHVALVLASSAGRFELTVLDDGPGVDSAALTRLLARGVSGSSGSGLGLAIVDDLARQCGWELSFHPADGRGLRVQLTGATIGEPAPDNRPSRRE